MVGVAVEVRVVRLIFLEHTPSSRRTAGGQGGVSGNGAATAGPMVPFSTAWKAASRIYIIFMRMPCSGPRLWGGCRGRTPQTCSSAEKAREARWPWLVRPWSQLSGNVLPTTPCFVITGVFEKWILMRVCARACASFSDGMIRCIAVKLRFFVSCPM